jgi:opacity protein-like surface antigen
VGGFVNGFAMVNPGIGLGAELGHMRLGTQNLNWTPPEQTEERPLEIGRSAWQLTGNVLARGQVGNFRPYLNGGAGLYLVQTNANDPAYSTSDSKSRFGFNVGGGLMIGGDRTSGP